MLCYDIFMFMYVRPETILDFCPTIESADFSMKLFLNFFIAHE